MSKEAPDICIPESKETLEAAILAQHAILQEERVSADPDSIKKAAKAIANMNLFLEHWPDGKARDIRFLTVDEEAERAIAELPSYPPMVGLNDPLSR